jgi:mono/diheme cytochrome c family protein
MRAIHLSILGALALTGCRGGESDLPPVHLVHNMDTQERGKAFRRDTSGLFADGRAMREPVAGTVARGQLNDDPALFEGLDEKGEPAQLFPAALKVDGAIPGTLADSGKGRYEIFCAPCHGVAGDGKGPIAALALDGGPRLTVPPASFMDERRMGLVAGQIYGAITNGVNAGNMPPYAVQLTPDERWAVVAYVRRDLQKQDYEGGKLVAQVKVLTASVEAGKVLYVTKVCNACHTLDGNRLVGPTFKGLYAKTEALVDGEVVVDDAYLRESMLEPMKRIVKDYPPAMPPQVLTDVEIESLILFIKSVK